MKVVERIESAAGVMIAAPSPWSARAAISDAFGPRPGRRGRGEREDHDAEEEDPPTPEEVGRPPPEEQEAAEHERVGADHPLEVSCENPRST